MSISVHKRFVAIAAVFVVAFGASRWLDAQQPAPQIPAADGQFYACVRLDRDGDEGRLARLVAVNEPCRRNETRVHWGATGPQGPRGINGTNGAPGTLGANGTNGVNGTSVMITGIILNGDPRCSNGGVMLSDAVGTSYLCHGANGSTAATRAAGPCFDSSNRYVNCGNGTVTDTVTGLIWLQRADCVGLRDWAAANQAAAGLKQGDCSLTDGSSPGDWRLPTRDEWTATIAFAVARSCGNAGPTLTRDGGGTCLGIPDGTPASFVGVVAAGYWSSTSYDFATIAVYAHLGFGEVVNWQKIDTLRVWPVRRVHP